MRPREFVRELLVGLGDGILRHLTRRERARPSAAAASAAASGQGLEPAAQAHAGRLRAGGGAG
jgi:hypothetical protein